MASERLREEFPQQLSEHDRHLTPSDILTPDIRKRNPAFLSVPMPERQVCYGPYYLMERSPSVRPQYIPQSSLVDVEHQLARLVFEVLRVKAKRGVTTQIRQFYMRLPSVLLVWYLACCVLGDVFRALCVGVGLVVTIGRFGA